MVSEVQGRETWGRECRLEIRRFRSNVEAAGMGMLTGIVRQARGTSSEWEGAGRWALGSGQRAVSIRSGCRPAAADVTAMASVPPSPRLSSPTLEP